MWFPAQLSAEAALRVQGVPAGSWLQEPEAFTLHITQFDQWIQPDPWISGVDQSVSSNLFRYSFLHTLLVNSQVLKTEGPSLPAFQLREPWSRFYCCLQLLSGETEKRGTESSGKRAVIKTKGNKLVAMQLKKIRQGLFFKTMKWLSTRTGCLISFLAYSQNSLEYANEQPKLWGPAVSKGLDKTTSQDLFHEHLDPSDRYFTLQKFL